MRRLNPGDGAFYGPKIDVHIRDALRRSHQCATIQLDFQLPLRFKLAYRPSEGEPLPPVIIHRAVFGSLERFAGILMEHTGGRWPLWLSPRQVAVVPIAVDHHAYAQQVADKLTAAGFHCDACLLDKTMNKRVAEASAMQYNYIVVVGAKEQASESVNVRRRPAPGEKPALVPKTLVEFMADLRTECDEFRAPADADWIPKVAPDSESK